MYTSDDNEAFLIWFHAGDRPIEIILPSVRWGESWHVVASTALPGEIPDEAVPAGLSVTLPSRCVVVMQASPFGLTAPCTRQAHTWRVSAPSPADLAAVGPSSNGQRHFFLL